MDELIAKGYTPLLYIESDGTQYIDTGVGLGCEAHLDIQFVQRTNRGLMGFSTKACRYFGVTTDGYYEIGTQTTAIHSLSGLNRRDIQVSFEELGISLTAGGETISRTTDLAYEGTLQLLGGSSSSGLTSYPCSARLFGCQIYVDNTLIRDYTPAKNSDGVCGLYDKANDVFYASATDSGFTGVVMGSNGLPLGYTKCEYIESDGTNYIDTGFAPNQNTRVVMDAKLLSTTGWKALFGAWTLSGSSYVNSFAFVSNGTVFRDSYASEHTLLPSTASISERVIIDKSLNTCTLSSGESITHAAVDFTQSNAIYLCANNTGGSATELSACRIYSCQIYDNGSLVRDYIPCQTNDGVYGLWDDVNKEFVAEVKQEAVAPTYMWSTVEGSTKSEVYSSAVDGVMRYLQGNGNNSASRARCTFKGVTSITFSCVYSGENNYDYLTIGNLDSTCTRSTYGTSLKGKSGTIKDITFPCTEDEHYVEFCYSKDGSYDEGDDCGYVYINSVVATTVAGSNPFTGKWGENKEMKVSVQEFRHRLMAAFGTNVFIPDYAAIDEYGVAIMDIRGKFYKDAASWQAAGSPTINGVAVSDGTHRFCIAKDIVENVCYEEQFVEDADCEYWGAYNRLVNGVTTTEEAATANTDYNGVVNTDAIVANVTSSDGFFTKSPWSAAGLCRQFIFPNGSKGYLGACGEWKLVNNVKSTVNTLLSAIGGAQLYLIDSSSLSQYWTSTQSGVSLAWCWSFYDDWTDVMSKTNHAPHVRAFCAF